MNHPEGEEGCRGKEFHEVAAFSEVRNRAGAGKDWEGPENSLGLLAGSAAPTANCLTLWMGFPLLDDKEKPVEFLRKGLPRVSS